MQTGGKGGGFSGGSLQVSHCTLSMLVHKHVLVWACLGLSAWLRPLLEIGNVSAVGLRKAVVSRHPLHPQHG